MRNFDFEQVTPIPYIELATLNSKAIFGGSMRGGKFPRGSCKRSIQEAGWKKAGMSWSYDDELRFQQELPYVALS